MKRGTTPSLKVKIGIDHTVVTRIDFVFKQQRSETCNTKVEKYYPNGGVTYDSTNDVWLVAFSEDDTRTFQEDTTFYMDTKISCGSGHYPSTKIVPLYMNATLFEEEEDD